MAKTKRGPAAKRKARRPSSSGGSRRPFEAVFSALTRAYGHRRRSSREEALDAIVLAVLSEALGERLASRFIGKLKSSFVDWNEIRVARPRDLAAASPEAADDRAKRMQSLLQTLYENLGGLDTRLLFEMKSTEARTWLTKLGGLSREEVDAVMMVALKLPVIPGSEGLARVSRRMGLVPRRATRARAQRAALKGVAPESYRDFYGLIIEHAVRVCHEQVPDCARCKLKRRCKSKGKW
jgi:endonuclease III